MFCYQARHVGAFPPQHTAAGERRHVQTGRHHRLPEDGEFAALRILQDPRHRTPLPAGTNPESPPGGGQ